MKRLLICLALVACQRERTQTTQSTATAAKTATVARPQNLAKAKVNAVLPMNAAEGLVQSHLNKDTFKRGEPIVVTITVKDPPKGIELRTQWFDAKNRQLAVDRKELMGQNTATFSWNGKPLTPGKYRVETFWGENIAGDHTFTVTK